MTDITKQATSNPQSETSKETGGLAKVTDAISKWREDLTKDIRFNDERDDIEGNDGRFPEVPNLPVYVTHPVTGQQQTMTTCNMDNIAAYFNIVKDHAKCVVEIGVDCNGAPTEMTATKVFLANKSDDTFYFGIDIDDKSYLDNPEKNIYTIRTNSANIEEVMNFIRSKGVEEIDFFFIDGWHSINQCLIEWEYTRWLSEIGIVGWHDTATHPGPAMFLKYLDTEKWEVVENSCNVHNDYGVGFAWKKLDTDQ